MSKRQMIEITNWDDKSLLSALRGLGRLPEDFDAAWVLDCLSNPNKHIRYWSVKTLGKLGRADHLGVLRRIVSSDDAADVRREAASAIGRLRSPEAIDALIEMLDDQDPEIICQAIRGLLVFKENPRIDERLARLKNHENELVRQLIQKEYGRRTDRQEPARAETHPASYDDLKNIAVLGDVLQILRHVPDESFHLTFTSPPYYNARDYSIYRSYRAYLDFLEEVFHLTHQKTKAGRFLIVNSSPIIMPRISRQHSSKRYPIPFDMHHFLEAMGWEFIDDIVWVKPESSVKNRNAGFLQHRKPLGYKPNPRTEYLMVYRKRTDKLIDWNMRQYDAATVKASKVADGYETSNIWEIDPAHDRVHSAVFPIDLCKRVIAYYSYKGDLVFDPFAGRGTFGRAAQHLERYFFLTEKDPTYFKYMRNFLTKELPFVSREADFLSLKEFADRKGQTA